MVRSCQCRDEGDGWEALGHDREREVGAGLEPTEGLTLEGRWSGGRASTFGETEVSDMDLGSGCGGERRSRST